MEKPAAAKKRPAPPAKKRPEPRAKKRGNPLLRAIGNGLYSLGFSAELLVLRTVRIVTGGAAYLLSLLMLLGRTLGRGIWRLIKGVGSDIAAPFVRLRRRRRTLVRVRQRLHKRNARVNRRVYVGVQMKTSLLFVAHLFAFLLPVASAVILVFTITNITGSNYALAVEINGKQLGYVAELAVVEDAKSLLRQRIGLAPNQELSDWQLNATYTVASADHLTTTQQLVDEILRSSQEPGDLVNGTGLYVDGQLVAVTTEGDRLREFLDSTLSNYEDPTHPEAEVQFAKEVKCDPASTEVFFASSVVAYDELIERISRNVTQQSTHVANGQQSYAEIAHAAGLTFEQLQQRNAEMMGGVRQSAVPAEGTVLLLRRAQPYLQVEVLVRVESEEAIPYTTVEREDENYTKGRRVQVQRGEEGLQRVWEDLVYIDGELVESRLVPELTEVLVEPVEEIIAVGTYSFSDVPVSGFGEYMFPVPDSTWSSRGKSSYHRGMDINAPEGTAIFASNEGNVITAGWHWSYGWHVVIEHPDDPGMVTLYAHCSSLAVEEGDKVMRGSFIGTVGSTGISTGPHVHLEFQRNGSLLDPMDYLTAFPEDYRMAWYRGGA